MLERGVPTWADVARAKTFFAGHIPVGSDVETRVLLDEYQRHEAVPTFQEFVSHTEAEAEPQLIELSRWLRIRLSAAEGLYGLIQSGELRPLGALERQYERARWTTVYQRSGGTSGGVDFPNLSYALPTRVFRPAFTTRAQPVGDPDIYILQSGLHDAADSVTAAIRDAQRCLAADLLEPAVAMLGKAMEGAWIEAGLALSRALSEPKGRKLASDLADPQVGLARKIEQVRRAYDTAGAVAGRSALKSDDLTQTAIWSHELRKSRNAIHFDSEPLLPNTPEKVGILFLAAPEHFRRLYRLRAASLEAASS